MELCEHVHQLWQAPDAVRWEMIGRHAAHVGASSALAVRAAKDLGGHNAVADVAAGWWHERADQANQLAGVAAIVATIGDEWPCRG